MTSSVYLYIYSFSK